MEGASVLLRNWSWEGGNSRFAWSVLPMEGTGCYSSFLSLQPPLTGESGSKNSCQKGFNVIDKPFVSTEAPPLASPNKTSQNLCIGGKTCWAACGIKPQGVSASVTSHSWFLQMTVQSTEKIPQGTWSCSADPFPSPCPLLPLPAATAAPLPFTTHLCQTWLFPDFSLFLPVLSLGKMFCFLLWDCCTLSIHTELQEKGTRFLRHCPFPIHEALDGQHEHSWSKVWSQV